MWWTWWDYDVVVGDVMLGRAWSATGGPVGASVCSLLSPLHACATHAAALSSFLYLYFSRLIDYLSMRDRVLCNFRVQLMFVTSQSGDYKGCYATVILSTVASESTSLPRSALLQFTTATAASACRTGAPLWCRRIRRRVAA